MDGSRFPPLPAARRGIALCCPRDGGVLREGAAALSCPRCGASYPVVGGTPILINDEASAYAIADYLGSCGTDAVSYGRAEDRSAGLRRGYRRFARRLGDSPSSTRFPDFNAAIAQVRAANPAAAILLVGSLEGLVALPRSAMLRADVALVRGVDIIADPHDLPFPDEAFDLVLAVTVLDHVADPQRCAAEFRRVLRPGGHVYATTSFLQPVHMSPHDFNRFTPMGQRRLFRHFDELGSGVAMGSGSVAAWALQGLLASISAARRWRRIARLLSLLLTPALRRLDAWLPHAADYAGGSWFFGRRREGPPISDRELVSGNMRTLGPGALAGCGGPGSLGASCGTGVPRPSIRGP